MSLIILICIMFVTVFSINTYVKYRGGQYIVSIEELKEVDAIVVLGCKVDGERLSLMLGDRLDKGIEVYHQDIASYIVMSGDHEHDDYNEVDPMKNYALSMGINEEDIISDPYGLNTYDSLYRLKEVYGFNKIIIITQGYHLYRALYIADCLGLEAYGVKAQGEHYVGQSYRELREIIARNKDFIQCIIRPESKYNE